MDPLEKQLMDLSGMTEEEMAAPAAPSAVGETDYASEHHSRIPPVRTFSSDLADAVREHGGSVVRVAIAEEERHRHDEQETSIKSKKNIAFIILGLALIVFGIWAVAWDYQHKQAASVVVPVTSSVPSSLVPADDARTIDATGMSASGIVAAVQNIVANPTIQEGQVENIILTETASGVAERPSAGDFLTMLGTHAPGDLLRALSSDYMLGTYLGAHDDLFLVVHGTSNDYLVSGMLEWEPWLFNDMVPLFNIDTSSLSKAQLEDMTFTDTVIGNHDTRAVLSASGTPLFYYSFLDDDTILFATDPAALSEVVGKL